MIKETKNIDLSNITEEELLNIRICDLPVRIEDSWLKDCVNQLYKELDVKGIKFKPPCYLADEWLTPDGEPVVGIPFFLAHPVLMKLEKKMMLDVEGGNKRECMKLLRHETGHAINYAYKLYRRKKWQKIFGKFSADYPETYRFRPYSKNFVRHLEDYYAQYHPDEDFAETFAVWLTPGSDWQNQYKGWKALVKLKYVDELMEEIKDKPPLVKKGKKYWAKSLLRITLKNYYKKKRHFYAEDFPDFHDKNLERIFTRERKENYMWAADLIKKYRKEILNSISNWTGEKKYIINDLLETIMDRCKDLKLYVSESEGQAILKVSTYVTTLIMNYIYTGRFRKGK
jgi:hypothetical protein